MTSRQYKPRRHCDGIRKIVTASDKVKNLKISYKSFVKSIFCIVDKFAQEKSVANGYMNVRKNS